MTSRQWQVVFHLHADQSATARVHVDGRLLLPSCDGLPVEQALGYVAAALIDAHPADRLALRTQGAAGSIRSIRVADAAHAQAWLQERAQELAQGSEADNPDAETETESARSGLRPALRHTDDQVDTLQPKKSGS